MTKRQKKEKHPVTIHLPEDLHMQLKIFAAQSREPMSSLVAKIIAGHLQEQSR